MPAKLPQAPDISVGAGHARDTGGGERKGARALASRFNNQRRRHSARGQHHRGHAPPPPTGAVERAMPAIPTPAKPPTIPHKTR